MEKSLQLQDLKVSNLPELQGWKEKQQQLVADNPYVEIVDSKTYDAACKSRTALLKGRTELEKQDKVIASQLTSFRKEVKTETENLIAITLPHEEKQQSEVKRYEAIKEAEKAEKERLEQERMEKIKAKIDTFESDSYTIIQGTTIKNVELHKTMLDGLVNVDFDYEEFDILFEQARTRVQSSWDLKCADIQEKEVQRLENERLELQNKRLVEIVPYVAYGEQVDLTKLSELSEMHYDMILESKKSLFEAEQLAKQEAEERLIAENAEKEAKAKADKEAIFDIRKNRLAEIGFVFKENDGFYLSLNGVEKYALRQGKIYDADAIDFENIITDAKSYIEKYKSDLEEAEKQKAIDEKLAKEDAERLNKENKARFKRLAQDKEIYKNTLNECLISFPMFFDSKNEEIKAFSIEASNRVVYLHKQLLTELENL
jgi:hypothetical protein